MRPHTTRRGRATSWPWPSGSGDSTRDMLGRVTVFASDEFYLVAGIDAAAASDHFESLDQAENGIGMVAAFTTSFVERRRDGQARHGFFQSVDGAPAWGYRAERGGDRDAAPRRRPVVV